MTDPMSLVRGVKAPKNVNSPLWEGPCGTGPQGGITNSLLNKFLSCRYRFKAFAIDGWRASPKFNHRIEYGNLFHTAEESFAKDSDLTNAVEKALDYAESLADKYPESRVDIAKWFNVLRVQFPEYVKYWAKHPDVLDRTPLLQEQVFDVPYKLPSGRVVRLRGKWDGVDLVNNGVYLVEHKTKGDVDEVQIQKQLTFDVQTMLYMVALERFNWTTKFNVLDSSSPLNVFKGPGTPRGVRYNVVRRPLSGGKGTIVRHKPTKSNPAGESEYDYYKRLRVYIAEEPATYFYRWTVDVTPEDIARFKREFLDPCLEFLASWYEVQTYHTKTVSYMMPTIAYSWRTPYGLTGEIVDGYGSDLDYFLDTGSTVGLVRSETLFPELQPTSQGGS